MQFKTLLRDQYIGDTEVYTKNYSHRNDQASKVLKRDPRVVLNYPDELKGDSHLQVAPHSRRFINPDSLARKADVASSN